jgi:class 3 adenylate cyclase
MARGAREQRKLVAIMFTDMVGYTALTRRDEALALQLVAEHHRLLRSFLPRFGGRGLNRWVTAFCWSLAALWRRSNALLPSRRRSPGGVRLRRRIIASASASASMSARSFTAAVTCWVTA